MEDLKNHAFSHNMSLKDGMGNIYQEGMEEEQRRYYLLCKEKEKLDSVINIDTITSEASKWCLTSQLLSYAYLRFGEPGMDVPTLVSMAFTLGTTGALVYQFFKNMDIISPKNIEDRLGDLSEFEMQLYDSAEKFYGYLDNCGENIDQNTGAKIKKL